MSSTSLSDSASLSAKLAKADSARRRHYSFTDVEIEDLNLRRSLSETIMEKSSVQDDAEAVYDAMQQMEHQVHL